MATSETQPTTDVLVVGAGPTGLALAGELIRHGVAVTVVDAAPGPFVGSRGKGLQPRVLELLDQRDLAGRLVSLGRFVMPLRRWSTDEDGEPRHVDHDLHPGAEPTPDSPYARPLVIAQWRTEQVLREQLLELGGQVRWGARVTGLTQDDASVRVELAGAEPVVARWVVGCDGGSSAVRRALGVPFVGETDEQVGMLIGDLVVAGLDRDHWHMWESVAMCPLASTDTFQFQSAPPAADGEPTVATYQDVLDRAGAGHVRVREVRWSSRWRLNVRMVRRFREGRVFLAGDAAHVHSPAGGQGMNTGIGDGINLGWKLAAVCAGADAALLDTYEAERLPVAAGVLGLSSTLLGRRFEQRGPDGNRALQLGLSYRGGPLAPAGDQDATGPQPGDRAPDAPLRDVRGDRVRLFELLRHPGWTLLGFGVVPAAPAGVRAVAVDPAEPADGRAVVVHDRGGHARRAYAPRPGELVAIRPDGYLGPRDTDPEPVRAYLDALLPAADVRVPVGRRPPARRSPALPDDPPITGHRVAAVAYDTVTKAVRGLRPPRRGCRPGERASRSRPGGERDGRRSVRRSGGQRPAAGGRVVRTAAR